MEKNTASEKTLLNYLHKIDPTERVYRLLRWILTVNRPALLKVPPKNQIQEMKTPYQYIMVFFLKKEIEGSSTKTLLKKLKDGWW